MPEPVTLPLTGRPGGTVERQKVGSNAIKRWVLTGGWRDALFINEPDLQYARVSLIGAYCNFLEQIAIEPESGCVNDTKQLSSLTRPVASETLVHHCLSEQSGQSKTAHRLALDFYRQSESDSDSETISKRVSEIDFEPEDRKDWPVDIATDIFAGPYLSSILIDTAFGPVPEGKN
ncbi:hypothetical protein N7457_007169 [Penicillium paradoxum]|uniref:uncharacterized protein n=1 Tax=Penicillium paradoxum TaxID=176176 RepID=UPI0025488F77|nr:uncharacterized protein N7457_007169 [Penicillium paradoxum]KAJ5779449.1 hypothetical protein N7457_007169 [Penicillium paradoxum]